MKITFFSNFLNHHQLPFCEEMIKLIGNNFTFVATEPIPSERIDMGYSDMNNAYEFVLKSYENKEKYEEAKCLSLESDIIIVGSAPNVFVDMRMKYNKITFKYSERFFKKGIYRRFIPSTRKKINNSYIKYANKNFYILCASAYTAYDLSLMGMTDNTYKWGYFPEVKQQNLFELMSKKENEVVKILWVGRLIDLKHTKDAIEVAKKLKEMGYNFSFDIIGSGTSKRGLEKLVKRYKLENNITFLGSMPPHKVRKHMESANIFLFTSNFNEGWGAVLNEAMNSGCAIVASHAIGSVPFLLENNKNGLVYEYGNNANFYKQLKYLLDNPDKQKEFGEAAYETLFNTWNAKNAANRFLSLSRQLLENKEIQTYKSGPISRAEIIKDNWIN